MRPPMMVKESLERWKDSAGLVNLWAPRRFLRVCCSTLLPDYSIICLHLLGSLVSSATKSFLTAVQYAHSSKLYSAVEAASSPVWKDEIGSSSRLEKKDPHHHLSSRRLEYFSVTMLVVLSINKEQSMEQMNPTPLIWTRTA